MTLSIVSFNIWAVLVCIICNMLIGVIWYSPILFGNVWLKLVGKNPEDINKKAASNSMMLSIIPAVLSIVFLALILAFVNASTIVDALIIGSIISAGFIGMSSLNLVLFEDRPLKLVLLNVGYFFVSLNVVAIILTLWK